MLARFRMDIALDTRHRLLFLTWFVCREKKTRVIVKKLGSNGCFASRVGTVGCGD